MATYLNSSAAVNVSLDGTANDGQSGEHDQVEPSVEDIQGSNFDDTLQGGGAANTLLGGDGADLILGDFGNDTFVGGRGNDTEFGGPGNDVFTWNPGDNSDVVEGQGDGGKLQFNGANISEKMDLSANGSRLRLTRDVAGIVMDVAGLASAVAILHPEVANDRLDVNSGTGSDAVDTSGLVSGAMQVFVDGAAV